MSIKFDTFWQNGITLRYQTENDILLIGGPIYVGASGISCIYEFAQKAYGNGELFLIGSQIADTGNPDDTVFCDNYRNVN